ncbi:class I SAM-dependent methyltransferase [Legionella quinlivanii]|uniref:class I SAM-dependent methyltransferase n=1 Tax=Legionella quinlivanii TaxID=45073 RepID=UPI002244F1F9|nr:class I SAM-dependent methyltransferase [Legionella quinlivanii]MCW8451910.1 class I SAM-dependent methyltransferase [Legionella quinlivanii]
MLQHIYANPNQYSKYNQLQYDFAMSIIKQIDFSSHFNILDLGCGDGRITNHLALSAQHAQITGIDISLEMIDFATKEYNNIDNLSFSQMDMCKNLFQNEFDLITSFNTLHWIREQSIALKGIAKAAQKNGLVILLLSHKKSYYHECMQMVCSMNNWKPFFQDFHSPRQFYSIDQYSDLLTQANLIPEKIEEKYMTCNLSVSEFKNFILTSSAQVKLIPPHLKTIFADDFYSQYIQMDKDLSSSLSIGFWCLHVTAKPAK